MRAPFLAALAALGSVSASAQTESHRTLLQVTAAGDSLYCESVVPDASQARQQAPSLGAVDLLNVRIRFADDAALPSPADLAQQEAWFAEASYGRMTLTTAEASVELSQTRAAYAAGGDTYYAGAWLDEVHERLEAQGLFEDAFDVVSYQAEYLAPLDLGGAIIGRGQLGGRRVWVSSGGKVLTHEIGHTLGLRHANARAVDAGNPLSGGEVEYGNQHDVMGRGDLADGLGVSYKQYLGWQDAGGVQYVATTGTYRLWAANADEPGDAAHPTGLELPYAAFRVETRTTTGGGLLLTQGSAEDSFYRTVQIDATPASSTGTKTDLLLPAGGQFNFLPFVDPSGALLVRHGGSGQDARGAWVDVEVVTDINTPPTVEADDAVDGQTFAVGETVPFSVDVTDPDGTVESVVYEANGRRLTSSSAPPFAAGWEPSAAGTYSVRARATDDREAESVSPPFAVRITDGTPLPSDPIGAYGLISLSESTVPGTWSSVVVGQGFDIPVVLVGANTLSGAEPAVVSVRDVASAGGETSFSVYIDAWRGGVPPTTLSFLIVEAGTHRLPSGPVLQAGYADAETSAWTPYALDAAFAAGTTAPPILFATSSDGSGPALTRLDASDADAFRLRLRAPEDGAAPSGRQRVAFVAVAQALEPDPDASRRLETGTVQVREGDTDLELLQSYGTVGPRPILTALQRDTGASTVAAWASASSPYTLQLTSESPDRDATYPTTLAGYVSFGPVELPSAPAEGGTARAASVVLEGDRGPAPPQPETPPGLEIAVTPNPSLGGQGRVRVTNDAGGPLRVTLNDALGRRIAVLADREAGASLVDVRLPASLAPGVYVVLARSGDEMSSRSVTVLR